MEFRRCDVLEKNLGKRVILSYFKNTKKGMTQGMNVEKTEGILKKDEFNYVVFDDKSYKFVPVVAEGRSFIIIESKRYDLSQLLV